MKRIRAALVAVMVAVTAGTGCDQIDNTPLATDLSLQASVGNGRKAGIRLAQAQTQQAAQTVTEQIGRDGGWISIGNHHLYVGPNAVNNPTRFVMTLREGEHFVIDLHAYRPNGNVVSTFPSGKVFLYMTYQEAVMEPSDRFGIGYLPTDTPEGGIEPQYVFQYPQYNAVGTMLTHFSSYALIVD
jgi:hypothetical protein